MAKKEKMSPMFKDMTTSDIPKTDREKKMWIAARRIVAKQVGLHEKTKKDTKETTKEQEEKMPWGLVTAIYKNAKNANKIPKREDWKKAKPSETVKKYVKPDNPNNTQERRKLREHYSHLT